MKFIRQTCIILLVSFAAEALHSLLPLPIPASIYGLALMFALLATGALPLKAVKQAGDFLVEIMPLMFIPAAVGLMQSWAELGQIWLAFLAITLLTTLAVMAASGKTADLTLRLEERKRR